MSDDCKPIRILAVDEHPLPRQGFASLIADELNMTLVAEASNGREAIGQFRRHRPGITLMDLRMPEMNCSDRKGEPGVSAVSGVRLCCEQIGLQAPDSANIESGN